ncbi:energy transducer TonB [Acidicapsa ligni]|uniref:energy transducer TonB n=1 Tax=Acidicapsa ligni TaxID=542300 RepID=UPI0021E04A2F|nr:energy transducer TonB [Acidicapsa ligni]
MKTHCILALLAICAINLEAQSSTGTISSAMVAQPPWTTVYTVRPGVVAPNLLQPDFSGLVVTKCSDSIKANIKLSLIVDENGHPRNVMFVDPSQTELDRVAIFIAETDRFNPGTRDGAPVAVRENLQVSAHGCYIDLINAAGKKTRALRLLSEPTQKFYSGEQQSREQLSEQALLAPEDGPLKNPGGNTPHWKKVGGEVKPPKLFRSVEPELSQDALTNKVSGVCEFSLIVDRHGLPTNITLLQSIGYGLDENATEAISKYRFKPAMKNGEPVAVQIKVEISFKSPH